jgi:hypothetical protein
VYLKSRIITISVIVVFAGCRHTERGGVSEDIGRPLVMGALRTARTSGSLAYWGLCKGVPLPDFPKVRAPQRVTNSPLETLREIFADDPKMRVTQEPNGMIRMVETDVPQDILNVKISHISFKVDWESGDALYTPISALSAIMATPEVQAFKRSHNIPHGPEPVNILSPSPAPELPHIAGSLDNVTLRQGLDHVVQTFPGLWVYENCSGRADQRLVFFTFYQNGLIR